jgi:hypothetical protein
MINSHIIDIEDIGPVLFVHSKKAKRLIIYVRPFKGVTVSVLTILHSRELRSLLT